MTVTLIPPPRNDTDFNSTQWQDFFFRLYLNAGGGSGGGVNSVIPGSTSVGVITPVTGTFTNTINNHYYAQSGGLVYFDCDFTVSALGTGSGQLNYLAPLPVGGVTAGVDPYLADVESLMHFNTSSLLTDFVSGNNWTTSSTPPSFSTSVYKFGGGSMFLGGNSWINTVGSTNFYPGASPFTVELWIYSPASQVNKTIWAINDSTNGLIVGVNGSGYLVSYTVTGGVTTATHATSIALPTGVWTNITLVRNSGTCTWYVNGTQYPTYNFTHTYSYPNTTQFWIGYDPWNIATSGFYGYVDEQRFTRIVARYTSSYTVQTTEFPQVSAAYPQLLSATGVYNGVGLVANGANGNTITFQLDSGTGNVFTATGSGHISGFYFT